jgi:hypothetical protein
MKTIRDVGFDAFVMGVGCQKGQRRRRLHGGEALLCQY